MSKFLGKEYEVLAAPLSSEQIAERISNDGFIEGVVDVSLHDIIDGDLDDFIDELSEKLIGSLDLTQVDYKIVGIKSSTALLIHVGGYVYSNADD